MDNFNLLVQPLPAGSSTKLASLLQPSPEAQVDPASKVVATIGPSSHEVGTIKEMLSSGMTAARFDLSCGTLQYHLKNLESVHSCALQAKRLCAMCLDVAGRTCAVLQPVSVDEHGWPVSTQTIRLNRGQTVILTAQGNLHIPEEASEAVVIPVSMPGFLQVAQQGDRIDIGRYQTIDEQESSTTLIVKECQDGILICEATSDLNVKGHMTAVHIPAEPVTQLDPVFTDGDLKAIDAFHNRGLLDFLIVGDVSIPEEVEEIRAHLHEIGAVDTKLLVKVNTAACAENFTALMGFVDGFVLSRGTLGLHTPPEHVATLQKKLLRYCNVNGKLTLVTRIVDSMQVNPRPTRAEATDIANSVLDGADGFVLSAQTTHGEHVCSSIKTVLGICRQAEAVFDRSGHYERIMTLMEMQQEEQMRVAKEASISTAHVSTAATTRGATPTAAGEVADVAKRLAATIITNVLKANGAASAFGDTAAAQDRQSSVGTSSGASETPALPPTVPPPTASAAQINSSALYSSPPALAVHVPVDRRGGYESAAAAVAAARDIGTAPLGLATVLAEGDGIPPVPNSETSLREGPLNKSGGSYDDLPASRSARVVEGESPQVVSHKITVSPQDLVAGGTASANGKHNGARGHHGLKALIRGKQRRSTDRRRSYDAPPVLNMQPKPSTRTSLDGGFRHVASWGTLSLHTNSEASPSASHTNLVGLGTSKPRAVGALGASTLATGSFGRRTGSSVQVAAAAAAARAAEATARPAALPMVGSPKQQGQGQRRTISLAMSNASTSLVAMGQAVGGFGGHVTGLGDLSTNAQVTAASAVNLASSARAKLLVVVTDSGHTVAAVAKYRPSMPVMSLVVPKVVKEGLRWTVKGSAVARQCNLLYGTTSVMATADGHPKGLVAQGLAVAMASGIAEQGDRAVVIMRTGGTFGGATVQIVPVGENQRLSTDEPGFDMTQGGGSWPGSPALVGVLD